MSALFDTLSLPWPWYVGGPLIGLLTALLLLLTTLPGFVAIVIGGFLVDFGARWADGCTSGHHPPPPPARMMIR